MIVSDMAIHVSLLGEKIVEHYEILVLKRKMSNAGCNLITEREYETEYGVKHEPVRRFTLYTYFVTYHYKEILNKASISKEDDIFFSSGNISVSVDINNNIRI